MEQKQWHSSLLGSLEKVLPNRPPLGTAPEMLEGLWGETLSFQLAYSTENDSSWLAGNAFTLAVSSPLCAHITQRAVGLVPVATPCCGAGDDDYLSHEAGLYPDLLTDPAPWRLRAVYRQWRSVWFTLALTPDTAAGVYPITVRVLSAADGALWAEHTLSVRVVGAALPPQKLLHSQWLHADCLADYYRVPVFSARHWQILEAFLAEAAAHGINTILTPLFTPPLDTRPGGTRTAVQLVEVHLSSDGTYSFSFERLSRFLALCQSCGITHFEMSHLFTQWGARHAPRIFAEQNGESRAIFGWDTDAAGPEYRAFLTAFLPELCRFLDDKGLSGHVFFHISDEPGQKDEAAYRAAAALVRPLLGHYPTLDALSSYALYRDGCVETPVPSLDCLEPFLQAGVPGLWTYFCTGQGKDVPNRFIAMPAARCRILGFLLYRWRLCGLLHWGYNFYNLQDSVAPVDPYRITDCGGAFQAGDPYLVYPGADGRPEESLRLVTTCEALFDLRACELLETLRGRDFVTALLEEELGAPLTFTHYPKSAARLLQARRRVNAEIALCIGNPSHKSTT